MNDFKDYKKELIAKGEKRGIRKMIASYRRNFNLDNTQIFPLLKESYGSNFTDEQLMSMLNSTK